MQSRSLETSVPAELASYMDSSGVPLSLSSAQGDFELLWVNQAFCALTGFAREDVVGRNCRLLQPEGGAGPVRDRIRAFLLYSQEEGRFVIPNVRRDGRRFVNLLYMSRLTSADGGDFILGSQFDATRSTGDGDALWQRAKETEVSEASLMPGEHGAMVLGTYRALAASAAIIAQARHAR